MFDLSTLHKGDVITLKSGAKREVVRLIDATGARGGIVDTKPVGGRYSRTSGFVLGDEVVDPNALKALVERTTFTGSGSAAMGVPVTQSARGDMGRYFVGTIVDVSDDRGAVWVRRYTDPADVSVLFSVSELELATSDDLVAAARYFLNGQYRETADLKAAAR